MRSFGSIEKCGYQHHEVFAQEKLNTSNSKAKLAIVSCLRTYKRRINSVCRSLILNRHPPQLRLWGYCICHIRHYLSYIKCASKNIFCLFHFTLHRFDYFKPMEALAQGKICVRKKLLVVLFGEIKSVHYMAFFSRFSNKKILTAYIFIVLRLNTPLLFQPQCFKPIHITTPYIPFWPVIRFSFCVAKCTQTAHFWNRAHPLQ